MITIWKYPFKAKDVVALVMPVGARILAVQEQHDEPAMWAMVDSEAPVEMRRFRVFGTGHAIEAGVGAYIGTFLCRGGLLVWHVFEEARFDRGGVVDE